MVYKEITVDVWRKPIEEVRVIQEEAEGRTLVIHVLDSVSPFDFTQKDVSFYLQKPDDTIIYAPVQAIGNVATVILTGQMMAAYGRSKLCELQVVDQENHTLKVTLPTLYIVKSNYQEAVESTDEFSKLAEALNAVESAGEVVAQAEAVKEDLIEKRDSGFFNGAPGAQGVQGIQGPKGEKGEKGDRGDSGVSAAIDGMYTLYVNTEGHLIAQYVEGGDPPPLSISDGYLIYTTGE